jgi:hypothetical protein
MRNFQVITGKDSYQTWDSTISKLPLSLQDSYFEHQYVNLQNETNHSLAALFVYESGEYFYTNPFIIRTIESICGELLHVPIIDLESPYGYGGPISTSHDSKFIYEADKAFLSWCKEIGVVSEFLRFHPLLCTQNFAGAGTEVEFNRLTYSITINESTSPIQHFKGTARNRVRGALQSGLYVQEINLKDNIAQFKTLYLAAMERKGALSFYNFSNLYFEKLTHYDPEKLLLLSVNDSVGIISMGLFLVGPNGMHYHLGASYNRSRHSGAFNLLMSYAVELAMKKNLKWIHLGGGLSNNESDTLSRFKRTISDSSHEYFTGKRLHRPDVWNSARNKLVNHNADSETDNYFQSYHLHP